MIPLERQPDPSRPRRRVLSDEAVGILLVLLCLGAAWLISDVVKKLDQRDDRRGWQQIERAR